jgi:plasmid stabilization system protein ParE
MKVLILESAECDLKELRSCTVKSTSKATWQATYNKLKASIRNLASFSHAGSVPPEFDALNLGQYRQVLCGMNRIIYEVRGDTLYVHLVVDSRRDMEAFLMRRLVR